MARFAGDPPSLDLAWTESAVVVSVATTDKVGLGSDPATMTLAPGKGIPWPYALAYR